jgi:hypothetical protein
MTRKLLIPALILGLGSSFVLAPTLVSAQDATTPPPAEGAAPDGPGMGMEHAGPGGMMFDFAAVDADGDGRITPEEMTAFRASKVEGLDANGDGKLSAEELSAQMMKGMQERADAMAAKRIEAQDLDGDGMLSVEELASRPMPQMGASMFERVDADGDGAMKAALGFRSDLREHLRHGREEPDILGHLPPAVETCADDEDDEVTLDRCGYASVDSGHRREFTAPLPMALA